MSELYYFNLKMGFLNLLIYFIWTILVPKKHWLWHPNFNLGFAGVSFCTAILLRIHF